MASLPAFPNVEKRNFRGLYFIVLAIFGSFLAGAGNCRAADETLQPGVVLPKVATRQQAEQSYALYLPSTYSAGKSWPIVYAFDPAARGRVPVELMKDAAEKFGYIIAASNNSRNGLWKMESEAATAVFNDTHARLSIDNKRVYFAGFSGAARVSATLAQRCKCSAGVILAGAGFTPDAKEAQNSFPVFLAIGTLDFDYGEMVTLDEALEKSKTAHFLRRFEGPHEWPSAAVYEEALAWLRLLAMKSGREPRDEGFIAARLALEAKRVEALANSDPFATWFEARQAAETFEGLADVSQFRAREKSLESERAVTDAAKHEKQEIKEQQDLTADIYNALGALGTRDFDNNSAPAAARNDLRQQILTLKSRADHEKRADKSRVLKRALTGVFVTEMESGRGRMDVNDPRGAEGYFELATAADPDSVWALTSLAVARASDGDRKAALETLRNLKEKWSDAQAFKDWLNGQAAFSKMLDTQEFRSLQQ